MKIKKIPLIGLLGLSIVSCNQNNIELDHGIYVEASRETQGHFFFKDGNANPLNLSNVSGTMFVKGNDVYVPAYGGYYKNGNMVVLQDAFSIESVFVKDNDVYATGFRNTVFQVAYWKNGVPVGLPMDPDMRRIYKSKIIVAANNDVYVGCTFGYIAANQYEQIGYWKNQTFHKLGRGVFADIAADGTDVHVVGQNPGNIEGVYWKNDVQQPALTGFNNRKPGYLSSVTVDGGNVYITGGKDCALYWKNGSPVHQINDNISPQDLSVKNEKVFVAAFKTITDTIAPDSVVIHTFVNIWQNETVENWGEGVPYNIFIEN